MTPIVVKPLASSYSVSITYNGGPVPNNVLVDAWVPDPTTKGKKKRYAIGQTIVLPQNTPCVVTGTQAYAVPLTNDTLDDGAAGLTIKAAVGYTTSASNPTTADYTLDTGSIGTVVTETDLPTKVSTTGSTFLVGPGPEGATCYDSDNQAFFGNYYLAPVYIQLASGSTPSSVQTDPLMVLGINKCCHVTDCATLQVKDCNCGASLHYIGVGYDREGPAKGDLFQSPAQNAFLHVTDANNGTDIGQGYVLPQGGASPGSVNLGVLSTTGYSTNNLTSNSTIPGEFNLLYGCFSFPDLSSPATFCGNSIFDIGIQEMLLKLPCADWPAGTFGSYNCASPPTPPKASVTNGVTIGVVMGSPTAVATPGLVSYQFTTGDTPQGPAPSAPAGSSPVSWQDTTGTPLANTPIVNSGRNPLNCYNYFYQGQCGVVGFNQISPPPTGCP